MKRLRPFFSYYGSKWRIAPKYPPPLYERIIEPLAGSAGYSLLYPHRKVVLIDSDPIIAGLWQYLIAVKESEILSIPTTVPDSGVDAMAICQEARWLVGFWLRAATTAPCKTFSSWGKDRLSGGRGLASYWGALVKARVASQLQFIRHWSAKVGKYSDAMDSRSTWFIDPPYEGKGRHYRHSSLDIDFSALGEWCRARQGQVIVCENVGATWLPFEPFLSVTGQTSGGSRRKSEEAVWMAGE